MLPAALGGGQEALRRLQVGELLAGWAPPRPGERGVARHRPLRRRHEGGAERGAASLGGAAHRAEPRARARRFVAFFVHLHHDAPTARHGEGRVVIKPSLAVARDDGD